MEHDAEDVDSPGGGGPYITPAYPPPRTQHAQQYDRTGSAVVTTVDWAKVVVQEPHTVVQWFIYLHHNAHPEALRFLYELGEVLDITDRFGRLRRPRPAVWTEYARQKLPCILMEVLCDPNMFSEDITVFKVCIHVLIVVLVEV